MHEDRRTQFLSRERLIAETFDAVEKPLPEAFSALILVFSNQDGEYLWLPLLLSRALSAV